MVLVSLGSTRAKHSRAVHWGKSKASHAVGAARSYRGRESRFFGDCGWASRKYAVHWGTARKSLSLALQVVHW